jgi:hypothetical protein
MRCDACHYVFLAIHPFDAYQIGRFAAGRAERRVRTPHHPEMEHGTYFFLR